MFPLLLCDGLHRPSHRQYCAILDVDGNGWSNRFVSTLVHYPTPVLKQASNATGAFEELYAPGAAIELFAPDLSDLLQRAAELVEDCRAAAGNGSARRSPGGGAGAGAGAGRGQRLAATMQATSRHLLDHVGIAEGWAYLLSVYAKLSYWRLNTSTEGFVKVDRRRCCVHAQLPPSLQADIRRWADMDGAQQQQGSAAAGAIVQGLGSVASLSVRQLLLYLLLGGNTVLAVVALLLCARWRRNSAAR
ncbi:hypothetical protein HXX76_015784 [Chlamydomonas incerta]|uniref:Uncharacterized protein n=1 Tax=Chlamydomonas incerta TaxID=51695 RepID=A0A835SHY7_CHLIN|nr:hypothetical protein HXX76_015784 [Chlamydomonas incerta]|eukprot:KAG2422764.1 hypothetical protein HXX76_015784 [Chlamydomonas incerta]